MSTNIFQRLNNFYIYFFNQQSVNTHLWFLCFLFGRDERVCATDYEREDNPRLGETGRGAHHTLCRLCKSTAQLSVSRMRNIYCFFLPLNGRLCPSKTTTFCGLCDARLTNNNNQHKNRTLSTVKCDYNIKKGCISQTPYESDTFFADANSSFSMTLATILVEPPSFLVHLGRKR